jgi:transposase
MVLIMTEAHRRHDLSDEIWQILEPHFPGRSGSWGGRARDNRQFINAVFWILRTAPPLERSASRLRMLE